MNGDEPEEKPPSLGRLYIGNLPTNATKADVQKHFESHGAGEIVDIKLMNGFGFIEYSDHADARDVVPAFHGTSLNGQRIIVQFARGDSRRNERAHHAERQPPRTRRTQFRMNITGLPGETSWQDLKDFARVDGLDVVYSEVSRDRDGRGFVEYETEGDLKMAVEKIDGREFRGNQVNCVSEIQPARPRGAGDRFRSRSPPSRRYGPPGGYDDYYDRRPPPRGYSPRGYRDRSPPPPPRRDPYYERDRGYSRDYAPPPPRRGPPVDEYSAPRRDPYYDDARQPPPPRGGDYGPPPGRYAQEPYGNGGRPSYDSRGHSPRRRTPPAGRYDNGSYDRRGY